MKKEHLLIQDTDTEKVILIQNKLYGKIISLMRCTFLKKEQLECFLHYMYILTENQALKREAVRCEPYLCFFVCLFADCFSHYSNHSVRARFRGESQKDPLGGPPTVFLSSVNISSNTALKY